jgi:chain length determinant protein EpsF
MSFTQFLVIVRARWRITLAMVALGLLGAVLLSLILPKRYAASASVVVDVRAADPIAGASNAAMLAPSYMATQVDIMQSDRVALRVVRALRLAESASMRDEWQGETGGQGNYESWLARLLLRKLDVRPSRESNVIEVAFSSVDPRFSVAVANGFAQAYLDTVLDLRVDPARRYSEFFDERGKKLREEVEAAQARLSDFQKRKGIVATDEKLDIETARINELSTQLVALQAASADSRSRQVAAGIAPEALPDVIGNPVVQSLRTEQVRQESRVKEMSERLGDAHPVLIEARASLGELRARQQQEVQRLSAGVGVSSILSESREAQVRASLDAQRARLLQIKSDRDELVVLQRDLEQAQRTYDAVAGRLAQMTLESASSQTNASLLVAATEPSRPSFPRWPLNLSLGAFAGLLMGIAGALGRESVDRRVRTIEDVAREMKLPVLGELLPQGQGRRRSASVELLRPTKASADAKAAS